MAFSKEVIRFQPPDLFGFALEYFTGISGDSGSAESFLIKQGKLADAKQKEIDQERKRTKIAKEKHEAKKRVQIAE